MTDKFSALALLRSLGDFENPTGSAARLQIETMTKELRELALTDPNTKYRITEEGPEQTIAEILAEFDADDAAIAVLKATLKQSGKA